MPEAPAPTGGPRNGLRGARPWLVLALLLVVLDLVSKSLVIGYLERWDPELGAAWGPDNPLRRDGHGHERLHVLGDWLTFRYSLNYGAAFGRLTGIPYGLIAIRCAAIVLLTVLLVRVRAGTRVLPLALAAILAGAAGNLWDNLFARPHPAAPGLDPSQPFFPVRDFVDVYLAPIDWHFPTFNVADACITVGALLLLASSFRRD